MEDTELKRFLLHSGGQTDGRTTWNQYTPLKAGYNNPLSVKQTAIVWATIPALPCQVIAIHPKTHYDIIMMAFYAHRSPTDSVMWTPVAHAPQYQRNHVFTPDCVLLKFVTVCIMYYGYKSPWLRNTIVRKNTVELAKTDLFPWYVTQQTKSTIYVLRSKWNYHPNSNLEPVSFFQWLKALLAPRTKMMMQSRSYCCKGWNRHPQTLYREISNIRCIQSKN